MKKIFAIALALVMVLSMASAFATTCPTISWDCPAYTCSTGKGSVEVIPYVKGNACGGNSFTANTCAGAINGDEVYFAVKVTVEADPSEDWWNEAALTLTLKGLKNLKADSVATDGVFSAGKVAGYVKNANTDASLKAGEYYLVFVDTAWTAVKAADFEATADTLFVADVDDAAKAKVCAKLTSAETAVGRDNMVEINGYKVWFEEATNSLFANKNGYTFQATPDSDSKVEIFQVWKWNGTSDELVATVKTYNADKTAFFNLVNDSKLDWTCDAAGKALKAFMDYFKVDFGTCVTLKAFKANFGWDNKVEACFSWSDKVQAVVDAECVVAIPKTGDASVLAWLF